MQLRLLITLFFSFSVLLTACQTEKPTEKKTTTNTVKKRAPVKKNIDFKRLYNEASKGKIYLFEFEVGTKKDEILKKWGKPTHMFDTELTYSQPFEVDFTIDHESQKVRGIRLIGPNLKTYTLDEVIKEIGQKGEVAIDEMPTYEEDGTVNVDKIQKVTNHFYLLDNYHLEFSFVENKLVVISLFEIANLEASD